MADKIGTEIGRKLSVQAFGFNKEVIAEMVLANKQDEHFLARFQGVASGVKPYENDKGEVQYGLIGDFEGTGANGDVLPGNLLYLPTYVSDQMASILERDPTASIDIAHDVYAHYDKDSATMYVFTVRSLIQVANPRVEAIKAQLAKTPLPSLPAPAKGK